MAHSFGLTNLKEPLQVGGVYSLLLEESTASVGGVYSLLPQQLATTVLTAAQLSTTLKNCKRQE